MISSTSPPGLSINGRIRRARKLHREGSLEEALQVYHTVLEQQPENADALYLSGLVRYRQNDPVQAIGLIQHALRNEPEHTMALGSLAQIYQDLGDNRCAVATFQRAIQLCADNPDLFNGLGLSLASLGEVDSAEKAFVRALSLEPDRAESYNNLANLQGAQGRFEEAENNYKRSLAQRPGFAEVLNNLGVLYQQKQQPARAIDYFTAAIRSNQRYAQAFNNLGAALNDRKEAEAALECFHRALKISPNFPEALTNAGLVLQGLGQHAQARKILDQAINVSPYTITAQWARCMAELEFIYRSESEMVAAREKYERRLDALIASLDLHDPAQCTQAATAVGTTQPFLLPYQAQNDCCLQLKYGQFVSRIMKAAYSPAPLSPRKTGSIRIGIVSAFFYDHSNWKIPIQGWLKVLSERFEVYGYSTGSVRDATTAQAEGLCTKFHSNLSARQFAATILDDGPDVLIYPEVGMHPVTTQLAAQRLAKVQCASWGHPVTTGMPTMDYFLSSEFMEPPDAQKAYSEKMIRLKGLSFSWSLPVFRQTSTLNRQSLSLEAEDVVYLCVQNLSKYLPQHDFMLLEISKRVPRSRLLFIEATKYSTQRFKARLSACFESAGMDIEHRVLFVPRLNREDYHALCKMGDVFLDTPQWSGCNSTLEALHCDLPVVTLPGRYMRGRHSSAIYQKMQYLSLVAKDEIQYIELAVRLGKDREWYEKQRKCIAHSKHRLVEDTESVESLAALIPELIAQHA